MRSQICLFSLLSLFVIQRHAVGQQSTATAFWKVSRPEKWWAVRHPFIASKAYKLAMKAQEATKEMLGDSTIVPDGNGGQLDAFRHGYWMALLSQRISPGKAKSLGVAHEKGDYLAFKHHRLEENALPDSMGSVMDLCNNDSGIAIGEANKKMTEDELKTLVKQKVLTGGMKILKKNKNREYLTCEGKEIDLKLYWHEWNIPKCLVNSNWKNEQLR